VLQEAASRSEWVVEKFPLPYGDYGEIEAAPSSEMCLSLEGLPRGVELVVCPDHLFLPEQWEVLHQLGQ